MSEVDRSNELNCAIEDHLDIFERDPCVQIEFRKLRRMNAISQALNFLVHVSTVIGFC